MQDLGLEAPDLPAIHSKQNILPAAKLVEEASIAEPSTALTTAPQIRSSPDIATADSDRPALDPSLEPASALSQPSADASAIHERPMTEDDGGRLRHSAEQPVEPLAAGMRHVADEGAEQESQEGSERAESEKLPEKVATLMEKLPAEEGEQLKQQWEALRSAVERLKHVERLSVVSIAYRK